jgi:hypothetical protein
MELGHLRQKLRTTGSTCSPGAGTEPPPLEMLYRGLRVSRTDEKVPRRFSRTGLPPLYIDVVADDRIAMQQGARAALVPARPLQQLGTGLPTNDFSEDSLLPEQC